jgi:aspartate carbamoyltransferase catalytic subunit
LDLLADLPPWPHRGLVEVDELSREELLSVVGLALGMKAAGGAPPLLRGRRVALVFAEPSTRTRLSFARAVAALGGELIDFPAEASSLKKGEGLTNTLRTIRGLGADLVVLRHPSRGAAHHARRVFGPAVLNAGDGPHQHPSQAIGDLATIREAFGRVEGLRVGIVGDVRHSRVAHSDAPALRRLGAAVVTVGPPTLGAETARFEELLPTLDVVMMLRLQLERQSANFIPSLGEYHRLFGLTPERLGLLRPQARIMAPGPVNPGVEITEAALTDPRCLVERQVENGVWGRMALLSLCLRSS